MHQSFVTTAPDHLWGIVGIVTFHFSEPCNNPCTGYALFFVPLAVPNAIKTYMKYFLNTFQVESAF